MLPDDEKLLIKQIFDMMDYLGEHSRSAPYKPFQIFGPVFIAENRRVQEKHELTYWDIEDVHRELMKECREKAMQKWINIELANNNLFWCCDE